MIEANPLPNPLPQAGEGGNVSLSEIQIKAVLFDLDGTFANTAPDLAAALNHVRGLHKLPPIPLAL